MRILDESTPKSSKCMGAHQYIMKEKCAETVTVALTHKLHGFSELLFFIQRPKNLTKGHVETTTTNYLYGK